MKKNKLIFGLCISVLIIFSLTGCSDKKDKECKLDIGTYFDSFITDNNFDGASYNIELTSVSGEYKIHVYNVDLIYNDFNNLKNEKMLEIVNTLYESRGSICDGITYVEIVCNGDVYKKDTVYENVLLKNGEEYFVLGGDKQIDYVETTTSGDSSYDSRYSSNEKGGREKDAWVCAQDVVENNLKSPSSADFPWYNEDYISYIGDDKYIISAYVDAQNSFGADLRSNFTVTLTLTKNGYKDASCVID